MTTDQAVCAPAWRTKMSAGYTTDDGVVVDAHELYAVDCACGSREHHGGVWYADEARAMRSYERRVGA